MVCGSVYAELPTNAYIMDVSDGSKLIKQCSRVSPRNVNDYWTINEKIVASLEKKLRMLFEKSKEPDIDAYIRQYVGIIVEDYSFSQNIFKFLRKGDSESGKKRIYANMVLYDARLAESAGFPIIVCDGGYTSWGIEYDVESKEFMNYSVNGP